MAQSMSLVGLDVHASQTHAAVLEMSTGELRGVKLRMAPGQVVEFLATLPGPVRAVYEAGPTGFGLARAAAARGIDVRVVAAGKVPRASGDRVKTDKRSSTQVVCGSRCGSQHPRLSTRERCDARGPASSCVHADYLPRING